jgi:hypothetical protein
MTAGCGPAKTMKEEAGDLKKYLVEKFGETIKFNFVDVDGDDMKDYPDIQAMLNRVRLPLTVINGEPSFHGGLSADKISGAINIKLKQ